MYKIIYGIMAVLVIFVIIMFISLKTMNLLIPVLANQWAFRLKYAPLKVNAIILPSSF
jgi:hypothetical protein